MGQGGLISTCLASPALQSLAKFIERIIFFGELGVSRAPRRVRLAQEGVRVPRRRKHLTPGVNFGLRLFRAL